jgi:CheY-like chemotaxis protein
VNKVNGFEYDLLLVDSKMPVMDGITCIRKIRTEAPQHMRGVPIISLTASATSEEQERCLEAGANAFISKPFDPKVLASHLHDLLRHE